jgi:hypothetical protein
MRRGGYFSNFWSGIHLFLSDKGEKSQVGWYGVLGEQKMSATKTVRGKCPNCCPDGGAIFTVERDWDKIDQNIDDNSMIKRCHNCDHKFPFRQIKATGKITPSQQKVINRITSAFGGTYEIKMIGRKVWLSGKNYEDRNWITGDSYYGTIGPGGAIEITLQRCGEGPKITDNIGIEVYLTTTKKGNDRESGSS